MMNNKMRNKQSIASSSKIFTLLKTTKMAIYLTTDPLKTNTMECQNLTTGKRQNWNLLSGPVRSSITQPRRPESKHFPLA